MAFEQSSDDMEDIGRDIDRAETLGMMAVALSGIGVMFLATAIAIWL